MLTSTIGIFSLILFNGDTYCYLVLELLEDCITLPWWRSLEVHPVSMVSKINVWPSSGLERTLLLSEGTSYFYNNSFFFAYVLFIIYFM